MVTKTLGRVLNKNLEHHIFIYIYIYNLLDFCFFTGLMRSRLKRSQSFLYSIHVCFLCLICFALIAKKENQKCQ